MHTRTRHNVRILQRSHLADLKRELSEMGDETPPLSRRRLEGRISALELKLKEVH